MEDERVIYIARNDAAVCAAARAAYQQCRLCCNPVSVGADRELCDFLLIQFARFNLERNEEIMRLRAEVIRLKMLAVEPMRIGSVPFPDKA